MSLPPCYPPWLGLGIYSTSFQPLLTYTDKRFHPIQTRSLLRKGNCLPRNLLQVRLSHAPVPREYAIAAAERVADGCERYPCKSSPLCCVNRQIEQKRHLQLIVRPAHVQKIPRHLTVPPMSRNP